MKLRRRARLEIRDARRRYTWRAGKARGRFSVRDQGLDLPAGRTLLVRAR